MPDRYDKPAATASPEARPPRRRRAGSISSGATAPIGRGWPPRTRPAPNCASLGADRSGGARARSATSAPPSFRLKRGSESSIACRQRRGALYRALTRRHAQRFEPNGRARRPDEVAKACRQAVVQQHTERRLVMPQVSVAGEKVVCLGELRVRVEERCEQRPTAVLQGPCEGREGP
jgi:hypothetical protein